jgi:signal transduction histidine kinase
VAAESLGGPSPAARPGRDHASQAARAQVAALTERARLAREIHDILAHALRLCYGDHDIELAVDDTRSGDAMPPAPPGLTFGGYGLAGMRERAELLGGRLTAGPTGTGFQVRLRLPASPQPRSAAPA